MGQLCCFIVSYGASVWYSRLEVGHERAVLSSCQRMNCSLAECRTVSTAATRVPHLDLDIIKVCTSILA